MSKKKQEQESVVEQSDESLMKHLVYVYENSRDRRIVNYVGKVLGYDMEAIAAANAKAQ